MNFFTKHHRFLPSLLLLAVLSFSGGCNKDEPVSEFNAVNNWVYDNMDFWYYWNAQLPSRPNKNQSPDLFFRSLKVSEDRFSEIYDDYEEILNALEGVSKEAGYEFILYQESQNSSNLIAQVLYIKPESPASATSLKRGDIITHINDQQITIGNYRSLIRQTGENHSITYRPLTVVSSSDGSLGSPITISINAVSYEENPNFLATIFDLGDKKAGYFVYNFFAPGIGDGQQYNNQMDQIMADFKTQGITDLIVDLRYNGGGYVSASKNLASLIGKNIDNTKVYTRREYNQKVVDYFNLKQADLTEKFIVKADNIGNSLPGSLYILTGSRTASASELVINGLRPFMNVTLIGKPTVGKNVGSIPIYKENDPKNRWIMLPIVAKSFNSSDQSEYGNGFIPEYSVDEGIYLFPLGDPEEPLLSMALAQISDSPGRFARPQTKNIFGERLGTSLDFRHRGARNVLLESRRGIR
jgi:carboxyl-terminal processing protease